MEFKKLNMASTDETFLVQVNQFREKTIIHHNYS